MNIDNESINDIRKATGTLPSENPERQTKYLTLDQSLKVSLEDWSHNPYKCMFIAATSTWGDNNYESKWNKVSNENKLEVIKAVLTHNTLPQAREMVSFIFRVKGVPRWLFDLHTQTKFTTFMIIGCRDNNKIDCDFVFGDEDEYEFNENVYEKLKDLYQYTLDQGSGSWQSARAFLPLNYSHSYHFGQNLLSISSMKFDNDHLKLLYKYIIESIRNRFPLIGIYLYGLFYHKETIFKYIKDYKYHYLYDHDKKYFEEE